MAEFITHFGIDWKLFLAQVVNFSVIFFVLRQFAYQPILKMLRERREGIEKGIHMRVDAEKMLQKSDETRNKMLQQAHTESMAIVNRAEQIGKEKQEEILKETDAKVERIIADARRIIYAERSKMNDEVYQDAEDLIRTGIGRIIGKIPASERDSKLIAETVAELKSI